MPDNNANQAIAQPAVPSAARQKAETSDGVPSTPDSFLTLGSARHSEDGDKAHSDNDVATEVLAISTNEAAAAALADRPVYSPARKRIAIAGLTISLLLVALDLSVITNAVPTIAKELNGFDTYSWIGRWDLPPSLLEGDDHVNAFSWDAAGTCLQPPHLVLSGECWLSFAPSSIPSLLIPHILCTQGKSGRYFWKESGDASWLLHLPRVLDHVRFGPDDGDSDHRAYAQGYRRWSCAVVDVCFGCRGSFLVSFLERVALTLRCSCTRRSFRWKNVPSGKEL